jgi:putative transposase
MLRQMLIEYPGAIYHVPSRGDHREPIFLDDGHCHDALSTNLQTRKRTNEWFDPC